MILLSEKQEHHLITTYILIKKFTRLLSMLLACKSHSLSLDCKSVNWLPCDEIIGFPYNGTYLFLLNWLIYSLPTATSFVSGNHTLDLFYLLSDNFKNLLFDLLITGKSFENLPYLSSCLLPQRWRFRRIRSNVLRGIELDLAYTKVSGASQYIF